ncbi:MAG TPA: hypoxanthine phosphoribosyltransferase [Saccharofermentans sp.]|nr:hypoxanthine phosphoribosyltransferase [Saccharofermentans sp.]
MLLDTSEVLVTSSEIRSMVERVGKSLNADYGDEELVVIGVLTGAYVFVADLVRELRMPVVVDFIQVSSYDGTVSSGQLTVKKDISVSIEGRNVLIVEDIIDTGYNLTKLKDMLLKRNPKSLKICTAFNKYERRVHNIDIDYKGICIPNKFIVGYGLDYDGEFRNLRDVCVVSQYGGN